MNRRQAQRLLRVARALRESPAPLAFTMECFLRGDGLDPNEEKTQENHWCGTPACAIGHYASRSDLQRLLKVVHDLQWDIDNEGRDIEIRVPGIVFSALYGVDDLNFGDDRFLEHFGISYKQACQLFCESGCGCAKKPATAAAYIERFVKRQYGSLPSIERVGVLIIDNDCCHREVLRVPRICNTDLRVTNQHILQHMNSFCATIAQMGLSKSTRTVSVLSGLEVNSVQMLGRLPYWRFTKRSM